GGRVAPCSGRTTVHCGGGVGGAVHLRVMLPPPSLGVSLARRERAETSLGETRRSAASRKTARAIGAGCLNELRIRILPIVFGLEPPQKRSRRRSTCQVELTPTTRSSRRWRAAGSPWNRSRNRLRAHGPWPRSRAR